MQEIPKRPDIRVVGKAPEGTKERIRDKYNRLLTDQINSLSLDERKAIKKHEYQKSEKAIALINFANKITSELMKEIGVEPFEIPLENFHIISSDLYKKYFSINSTATTLYPKQAIIFNIDDFRDNPLRFALTTVHEILHLKSYIALQVEEEQNETTTKLYRSGVSAHSLQEQPEHEHFEGLHEAIVTEIEKRFYSRVINLPELAEEKEWLDSPEGSKIKKEIAQNNNIPVDDVKWINRKDKKWVQFSYDKQRAVLSYVCSEIQKQFQDQYKNTDEVFQEFVKAHFTGNLNTIAKLVESTFGEVFFRVLGNMSTDPESGVLHLETLKAARFKELKKRDKVKDDHFI